MTYGFKFEPGASRQLHKLPRDIGMRVQEAIRQLTEDPRPQGCLKLKTSAKWRIRVGDCRVKHLIDDSSRTLTVTEVGHRSSVYDD
jgi:mRNA interferase RelE/StbE